MGQLPVGTATSSIVGKSEFIRSSSDTTAMRLAVALTAQGGPRQAS